MALIVLFGNGLTAQLAHFYLSNDSEHEVVAFTVDRDHASPGQLSGLPVVPFDEVSERYPPASHKMLVALSFAKMNAFRAERYADAKALGYELISYVSSRATVWPGAEIGENCIIMEDTTIQPFARVGDDVVVWAAGHIGAGASVGNHCFIASQAVVCSGAEIAERCFVGVNSTVVEGVRVAREAVIGAGALVDSDTAEREVFSPAKTIKLPVTSDRLPAV
jgi:sugar O-acyltransferase (sialic acid O-acetyltransferase NeuD family)